MAGSNNILQFDAAKNNIQTDIAYAASSDRTQGVQTGAAHSNVHNKLFYQLSTLCAALGEMMAAKGYAISDASLSALTTVLANIMTLADMTTYALTADLASYIAKAAVVTKTDSYAFAAADYYKIFEANKATSMNLTLEAAATAGSGKWIRIKNIGAGVVTLIGTLDGTVNPTMAQNDEVTIYSNGVTWKGKILAGATSYEFTASKTENGYQKLPSGLIIQWGKYSGALTSDSSYAVNLPIAFPTAFLNATANIENSGAANNVHMGMQVVSKTLSAVTFYAQSYDLAFGGTGFFWHAIGY
jgi:hypothetical protein